MTNWQVCILEVVFEHFISLFILYYFVRCLSRVEEKVVYTIHNKTESIFWIFFLQQLDPNIFFANKVWEFQLKICKCHSFIHSKNKSVCVPVYLKLESLWMPNLILKAESEYSCT